MSDSLIAQVKRLAEFQERVGVCPGWEKHQFSMLLGGTIYRGTIDFPALLAHLQAQQAVVDAARELRKLGPRPGGSLRASIAAVEAAIVALDAALAKGSQ